MCVRVCVAQVSAGIYWSVPDSKSSSQNQDGPRVHFHGPDSRYLSVTSDYAPEIEPSVIPVISDCVLCVSGKSCTDKVQPQSEDSKYGKLASKLTCNSEIQQDEP